MMNRDRNLWSIILAGGSGERLRSSIRNWFGVEKPKQYCAFTGSRSMFQHTLDRADQISAPEHKVIIISRLHRAEALSQLAGRPSGKIILQPANRDTAAGIFLPLAFIMSRQPEATVIVFPSDHFVYPEAHFAGMVRNAAKAVENLGRRLLLLGVHSEEPNGDYGWIRRGPFLGWAGDCPLFEAESFLEKPDVSKCRRAMADGALCNTLILVARAKVLWELGRVWFPEMISHFSSYAKAIEAGEEQQALASIYARIPSFNFSTHLLQQIPERLAVLEMTGLLWSDWGRPERILGILRRLGKTASFTGPACPNPEIEVTIA